MIAATLASSADHTVDFTAHRHPSMAVPCPACRVVAGAWCKRPSGHKAWGGFHRERHQAADRHWYEGRYPIIRAIEGGFAYDWCETAETLAEWLTARLAYENELSAGPAVPIPATSQLVLPL